MKNKPKYIVFLDDVEIAITKHAVQRYIERIAKFCKVLLTEKEARLIMTQQVKQSRMLKLKGNEEDRLYQGTIYCCVREKGLIKDTLVVKTTKITDVLIKKNFSTNFSMETAANF